MLNLLLQGIRMGNNATNQPVDRTQSEAWEDLGLTTASWLGVEGENSEGRGHANGRQREESWQQYKTVMGRTKQKAGRASKSKESVCLERKSEVSEGCRVKKRDARGTREQDTPMWRGGGKGGVCVFFFLTE